MTRLTLIQAMHRISKTIFRGDGTHVIIGGTGGLGRSMAKYMVEHGARTVVLLSRSGGGEGLAEKLQQEMSCPDARIVVKKCDASFEDQVWHLVNDCQGVLPPICGVIHAAMVLRVSVDPPVPETLPRYLGKLTDGRTSFLKA